MFPSVFKKIGNIAYKEYYDLRGRGNHFLGSRRPLDETPQVGCLSRSGVNKSVWRDGLVIVMHKRSCFHSHLYDFLLRLIKLSFYLKKTLQVFGTIFNHTRNSPIDLDLEIDMKSILQKSKKMLQKLTLMFCPQVSS